VAECNDLVFRVMPDVRAAEIRNARPLAPIARDLLFRPAEGRVVLRDVAAAAQQNAGGGANIRARRDSSEGAINLGSTPPTSPSAKYLRARMTASPPSARLMSAGIGPCTDFPTLSA